MLAIIIEVAIEAAAVTFISTTIADGNFLVHLAICAVCFVVAIVGGIKRSEDKMMAGSGQRRYFMTFGHATVWAFFLGILLIVVE